MDKFGCASAIKARFIAFGLRKFSENRIFTDADDYSMEIEQPLADCPQNLDIFGMITRKPAVGDGPGERGLKEKKKKKTSSGSIIIAFGQR